MQRGIDGERQSEQGKSRHHDDAQVRHARRLHDDGEDRQRHCGFDAPVT